MGTNKDAVALCDNSFQMLLVHRWSFPFHLFSNLFLQSLQHKSVRSDLSTSSKPIGYPENCARGASRWWEEVCNVGTQCWCMRHSHASDVCKSQVPPTGTGKQFRLLWFMSCTVIHEPFMRVLSFARLMGCQISCLLVPDPSPMHWFRSGRSLALSNLWKQKQNKKKK